MVKIRRIGSRTQGDVVQELALENAVQEVDQALKEGHLVVEESPSERKMLHNALGLTENSEVTIYEPIAGGC